MAARRKANQTSTLDQLIAQAGDRAREAGVEIEPDEFTLEWYRQDWPARKRIFIEREIKVRDAFDKNKLKSLILNDAQVELYEASVEASADTSLEDYTLKCRRLGITTYYSADYLSDAIIDSGHHVRLVAQDPDTLRSLMRAVKSMYDHLRPEIKPQSKYNSIYDLEFNDEAKGVIGSRVSVSAVVPGQEEKGRGDTFTRLHLTEIPFWRGDPETAAVALCDAAKGGKISGESTAKGVGDWFHRKCVQGKQHLGGVRFHFFEWWWNANYQLPDARFVREGGEWFLIVGRPRLADLDEAEREAARVTTYTKEERQKQNLLIQSEMDCAEQILIFLNQKGRIEAEAQWTCDEVARRIAWRRQEIAKKGQKKFRVEYPENDSDPFTQTGGTVFDQTYTVVKCEPRSPEAGHQYVVALDPSMGIEGADPAAESVIDRTTGEQVYFWAGYKKQDAQGADCCELSDRYNDAEIVIESNMGEAAILEVERLGYGHRLYKYLDTQTQRDIDDGKISMRDAYERARPGLPMTERLKRLAVGLFEKAWREGDFKASSEGLCEEAKVFVQTGDKMGAKSGYHDDEIMCNVIGYFVVITSQVGAVGFKSSGVKQASAQARGY